MLAPLAMAFSERGRNRFDRRNRRRGSECFRGEPVERLKLFGVAIDVVFAGHRAGVELRPERIKRNQPIGMAGVVRENARAALRPEMIGGGDFPASAILAIWRSLSRSSASAGSAGVAVRARAKSKEAVNGVVSVEKLGRATDFGGVADFNSRVIYQDGEPSARRRIPTSGRRAVQSPCLELADHEWQKEQSPMATATLATPAECATEILSSTPAEQRVVLRGISGNLFEARRGDGRQTRLEVVQPGRLGTDGTGTDPRRLRERLRPLHHGGDRCAGRPVQG